MARRSATNASGTNASKDGAASERKSKPATSNSKRLNLALQGGGAHGAFAWGVLDRLMEDGRIDVDGIVGTSAGAMNAAVLAYGWARHGADGARAALADFWLKVSKAGKSGPLQPTILDKLFGEGNLDFSPGYVLFDAMSRMLSPYQLNPMNLNPLRDVLKTCVDFEFMRRQDKVRLFICASNVVSGKHRVFTEKDISADAVMASACLPFMFQAVEIDGEHYWDGGYIGNPPLYPLFYHTNTSDVLIVQLNPISINEVPTTAQGILDRINTLSFNSSLMREMRAINFVTKLIDHGFDDGGRLHRVFIHTVDAEAELGRLGVSSKLNSDWDFLCGLRDLGRAKAEAFLAEHFDDIGLRSSTDIEKKFL
jgi:NTE family protein